MKKCIKAEYDAILGQWEREDFYNHLSNYTKYMYNSCSKKDKNAYWRLLGYPRKACEEVMLNPDHT